MAILGVVSCAGIYLGLMAIVAYYGIRSSDRLTKYMLKMNAKDREDFTKRSFWFDFIQAIVLILGFLVMILAVQLVKDSLAGYVFIGWLVWTALTVIIGQLTVFRIPKDCQE